MTDIQKPTVQATPGSISMMPDASATMVRNKAVMQRLIDEVLNQKRYDVLPALMTDGMTLQHSALQHPVSGLEGSRMVLQEFHTGFSDLKLTVQSMIAEGDEVAVYATCKGTHDGVFVGLPATGKPIEWTALFFVTLREGKAIAMQVCDSVLSQIATVEHAKA